MTPKPLADSSHFTKIRVSGKDRISVLHNILTQDIKKIPVGGHAPAALLNNTGKVLLFMEVFSFDDFLILVMENVAAEKAIALIDKYIIMEDVSLENITANYGYFQSPQDSSEKFLMAPGEKPAGFQFVTPEAAETLRIEAGIPRYGADIDETIILNETGLETTVVSWTKGCYPGQEVVARIDTYKGLNRKLRKIRIPEPAPLKSGDKIYSEDSQTEIGWITSSVISGRETCALGYLKKGFFENKIMLSISCGGKFLRGKTL